MQQEERIGQRKQKTRRGRAWDWTGFGGKTGWDWMELLIVPLVLAVGAFWLCTKITSDNKKERFVQDRTTTYSVRPRLLVQGRAFYFNYEQGRQQREMEETRAARQVAADELRAQEERLQAYLQEMGTLLIDEDLLNSEEDDETRYLARARTLAVLREAEEDQKRIVVSFLAESGLAGSRNGADPVVSLANVNLAGADLAQVDYLEGADLTEANLSNAFIMKELDGASLTRARLAGADLTDVLLRRAYLNDADLSNANLKRADLREANLEGVDLTGADLSGTNLEGATGVTVEELEEQATSLEGATMPDGAEHD